ncbi:Alpha/Beta hydrolase protein [Aspergillus unguis]
MTESTHTFKQAAGLSLTIDIRRPDPAQDKGIVVLHIHGGYLVLGEKTTGPPHWLINACLARGWTFATPSYRLLPEASGLETLSDTLDAVKWIAQNVSTKIIIAGSSAGGYLSLATAAHPECPRPLAVLSIYGMLDPAGRRYILPGEPLKNAVEGLDGVVSDIRDAIKNGKVIDGASFTINPPNEPRMSWIRAMHEAALYPDILTRVDGLARGIAENGVDVIPNEYRVLFPASFGLKRGFPPTVFLHGDADDLVRIELSESVQEKLAGLGVDVVLERAEGQGHGFDHMNFVDLDKGIHGQLTGGTIQSLKRVIHELERHTSGV